MHIVHGVPWGLIKEKCKGKRMAMWDEVKASKDGPCFSQIFFADDLLLFAKQMTKIAQPRFCRVQ